MSIFNTGTVISQYEQYYYEQFHNTVVDKI